MTEPSFEDAQSEEKPEIVGPPVPTSAEVRPLAYGVGPVRQDEDIDIE